MIFEATEWLKILKDVVDIIQSNHTKELEAKKYELANTVYTDFTELSYRLDGNNVDIDTEQVELASEQIKYQALTTSITSEFQRLQTVIK